MAGSLELVQTLKGIVFYVYLHVTAAEHFAVFPRYKSHFLLVACIPCMFVLQRTHCLASVMCLLQVMKIGSGQCAGTLLGQS